MSNNNKLNKVWGYFIILGLLIPVIGVIAAVIALLNKDFGVAAALLGASSIPVAAALHKIVG